MTSMLLLALCLLVPPPGESSVRLQYEESGSGIDPFVRVRTGAWVGNGFDFEAIRTDLRQVRSDGNGLFSVALDAGVELVDRVVVFATAEGNFTNDTRAEIVGAYLGYRDRAGPDAAPEIPDEITLYAGGIWGRYEVEESLFGDFEPAFGFGGGIQVTWYATEALAFSLLGEYRLIEFDYEEPVLVGDTFAGGSTGWVGLALGLRF